MTGSFEYDVSTEDPGGYNEFGYFYESDATFARNVYEDTGQNPFRVDCEDVDPKYQDVCEATVGS